MRVSFPPAAAAAAEAAARRRRRRRRRRRDRYIEYSKVLLSGLWA